MIRQGRAPGMLQALSRAQMHGCGDITCGVRSERAAVGGGAGQAVCRAENSDEDEQYETGNSRQPWQAISSVGDSVSLSRAGPKRITGYTQTSVRCG